MRGRKTATRRRARILVVGSIVGALLVGCGGSDGGAGGQAMADRMSYSSLDELMAASEYALVGEVTGSRNDVLEPEADEGVDDGSPLPVTTYTVEVTDPISSSKSVGDTVEVNMMRGGLDSYTMTLHEGSSYLLFASFDAGDILPVVAVIEGVFEQGGDIYTNVLGYATTPSDVRAYFEAAP